MATAYFVETIERITEQQIGEEILGKVEDIRVDANSQIEQIKQSAINEIEQIKTDGVDTIVNTRDENSEYIASEKSKIIANLGDGGVKSDLEKIESDTNAIYEKITKVSPDTENVIENDIRTMIVNNGFFIDVVNDGNGNVTATMRRDV